MIFILIMMMMQTHSITIKNEGFDLGLDMEDLEYEGS